MALDTYAIITLADLKATLGITASTDDAQLEQAINAATAAVEGWLGRKVIKRRFLEWTSANGSGHVVVKNPPVGAVYWCASGSLACMTVSSTTDSDLVASVSVQSDRVTLTRTTSAGTETITNLAFTTYPTASLLAAAITATAGFSASVSVNCRARYINRMVGRDLLSSTANLTFADDAQNDVRGDLERGVLYLGMNAYPDEYEAWPRAPQTLVIDYDGGWEQASVPYEIAQGCRIVASGLFNARKRDPSLASESLGDYGYTLGRTIASDAEAMQLMYPWRRLR